MHADLQVKCIDAVTKQKYNILHNWSTYREKDYFTMTTSVDQGYSWFVLAACFTMRGLTDGFWSSLGILLVEWQTYFEASAGDVAIIGSMTLMVILLSGK